MKKSGLQNNMMVKLINNILPSHMNLIISYLDNQSINDIIQAFKIYKQKPNTFQRLIQNRYFIQTYLTQTDRSMYVSFYSEAQYIKIEYQQQYQIAIKNTQVLPYFSQQFSNIFIKIRQQISGYTKVQQFIEQIRLMLIDPQLPFPKLRKQSVASHCNSSFQFFLIDKLFQYDQNSMEQEYCDELQQYLQQFQILYLRQDSEFSGFYELMYSQWYKITYENYIDYLIEGNKTHNLIVIIIAIIDLIADSYSFYISSIEDSLHSFVEFNMRYNIFKNILLALQQKFSCLFKKYSLFCQKLMRNSGKTTFGRQMTIWNISLSKWYIHFHQNHERNFNVMFYLLKKINILSIKEENDLIIQENQAFVELRNRISLNQLQIINKDECFEIYSPIEGFLEQNHELYNQLIKEYIEYIIDLSINQYTVHWCGHSNHKLHKPYQEFQQLFLNYFAQYVTKIIEFVQKISNPALALDKTLLFLIQQLDRQFLKPRTLQKSIQLVESLSIRTLGQQIYYLTSLSNYIKETKAYMLECDKKLEFYNAKNNINNQTMIEYSIILQSEDFNKTLKQSGSTKASRMNKSQRLKLLQQIQFKDAMIDESQQY